VRAGAGWGRSPISYSSGFSAYAWTIYFVVSVYGKG